ncbi:hypothetical protein X975_26325, partial [Stegodyphus mimosarum]
MDTEGTEIQADVSREKQNTMTDSKDENKQTANKETEADESGARLPMLRAAPTRRRFPKPKADDCNQQQEIKQETE